MSRPILPANMRTLRVSDALSCPSGSNRDSDQPHSPTYQLEDVPPHFDFPLDVNVQEMDKNLSEKENNNIKDHNAEINDDTEDDDSGEISYAPSFIEATDQ